METSTIVFLLFLAIFIITIVIYFNKLVKALNINRQAFENVDMALKRRLDLISDLEEIISKLDGEKENILEKISKIRENLNECLSVSKRQKIEDKLSDIIKDVFYDIEYHKELKESDSFERIKNTLSEIELEIETSRKCYNEATRNYNILVERFPTKILAKLFNFKRSNYFDIDLLTRDNVNQNNGIEKQDNEESENNDKE